MRNQVGVSRAQDQEGLAGAEFYARPLVGADQIVGGDFAADENARAGAQQLEIAAALAIDEQDGVVWFEFCFQGLNA